MYLRKAWHYNKPFFILVALFIIGQVFVTYNRGMVFSPFYNYSMYAYPCPRADSIKVLEMYADGKSLDPSHYSTREWDKLTMAYSYSAELQGNEWVLSEIQRLTGGVGLVWPIDPYQNRLSAGELSLKWRSLFFSVTGRKLDSVKWVYYYPVEAKWVRK
jgi:hypothetical protein